MLDSQFKHVSFNIIFDMIIEDGVVRENRKNFLLRFCCANTSSLIFNKKTITFSQCIYDILIQGSLSQIVYIGPGFYAMKCRILSMKKRLKVSGFFYTDLNLFLRPKSETTFPRYKCLLHV